MTAEIDDVLWKINIRRKNGPPKRAYFYYSPKHQKKRPISGNKIPQRTNENYNYIPAIPLA